MMKSTFKKMLIILVFLIFSQQIVYSQILNIEKSRLEGDSIKSILGNIEFLFSIQEQQVRVTNFASLLNTSYFSELHQYIVIGNINLVKVSNEQVISNGYGHFRVNFLHDNVFSCEVFTQGQYDEVRGMNRRFLAGGGIRWKIKDSEKLTFAVGSGTMYEDESWSFAEVDSTTQVMKSSTYISYHHQLAEKFEINLIGYYQARFDFFDKPRLTGDINFNMGISEHLTFTSKFVVLYDAAPIVPIEKLIYTFENGLQINF